MTKKIEYKVSFDRTTETITVTMYEKTYIGGQKWPVSVEIDKRSFKVRKKFFGFLWDGESVAHKIVKIQSDMITKYESSRRIWDGIERMCNEAQKREHVIKDKKTNDFINKF